MATEMWSMLFNFPVSPTVKPRVLIYLSSKNLEKRMDERAFRPGQLGCRAFWAANV